MKIPIIILNYNSATDCKKCASFLRRQQGVQIELIIVDNCSKSEDVKAVELLCRSEGYTFIANLENRGYNAGNNIGLKYAVNKGYKYALIANPDMEFPQEDYLLKLINEMEADDDIVVCGGDIASPECLHQNPMMRDENWCSSWRWLTLMFKKKKENTYDFIDNYKVNHYCVKLSGCCLIVRLDFICEIGFFDEGVFLYCEEAILSRQVEQRGKKMYYVATVQAVHRHIKSEKGNPINGFRRWKKARIYYVRKYSGEGWLGKLITILSIYMYVMVFSLLQNLKK